MTFILKGPKEKIKSVTEKSVRAKITEGAELMTTTPDGH